jgi:hypothetical protein
VVSSLGGSGEYQLGIDRLVLAQPPPVLAELPPVVTGPPPILLQSPRKKKGKQQLPKRRAARVKLARAAVQRRAIRRP